EKAPCKFRWFTQKNQGVAAAMNLGIKNAEGEIVCFTADDCIADEKWIKELVKVLDDEKIGGVGGRIEAYDPKTLVEEYGVSFDQKGVSKISLITGNAAYRKEILEEVGMFDTKLKGLEDFDLGIRVKLKGYELKFAPDAVIFHRNYKTVKQLIKRKYMEGIYLACLSKKYTQHFGVEYALILLVRSIRILFLLPFRLLLSKERHSRFFKDLFDIVVLISTFFGFVKGSFSEKYEGERYRKKIDFLIDESLMPLIKRKLRRFLIKT
ncbi:MAG TPA: glycosyltransferase, partial [Thermoplasmatales archaeon]|nr:glycosyltransferase [Thermoplasmatales archaeon]